MVKWIVIAAVLYFLFLRDEPVKKPEETKVRRGWTLESLQDEAKRIALEEDIPPCWLQATAELESSWNIDAVGDKGKSIGLTQINFDAQIELLREMPYSDLEDGDQLRPMVKIGREPQIDDLKNPNYNLRVAAVLLGKLKERAEKLLAKRPNAANLGQIVRSAYKGPAKVWNALELGVDVRTVYPPTIERWDRAVKKYGC